jgi:hypothetical protein
MVERARSSGLVCQTVFLQIPILPVVAAAFLPAANFKKKPTKFDRL